MVARRLLASAAAAGALALAPAAASAVTPDAGVVIAGNESDPTLQIDQARAAGLRWVSLIVNWSKLEPTPGANLGSGSGAARWAELGSTVRYARSRGVKVLVTFKTPPEWARQYPESTASGPAPAAYDDFAELVGELARAHGDSIDVYSTWNEPNIELFWLDPDPAALATLHRRVAASVRQNDPTARVMLGPLAGSIPGSKSFLRATYAAGVKGTVNVLGWNTYATGAPERGSAGALNSIFGVASIMRSLDPGRRAWITETSWSTCVRCGDSNVVTPAVQSDYLLRTWSYKRRYLRGFIERISWYNLTDGQDPTRWSSNHGLRDNDKRPKPAYASMRLLDRRLAAPKGLRRNASVANAGISSVRMTARTGTIRLQARLRIAGRGKLRIEGYWRGRWRLIESGDARSGALRTSIPDTGWRAIRVRARGARGGWTSAGAVVPNAPTLSSSRRR